MRIVVIGAILTMLTAGCGSRLVRTITVKAPEVAERPAEIAKTVPN